jgi:hypothetical protein
MGRRPMPFMRATISLSHCIFCQLQAGSRLSVDDAMSGVLSTLSMPCGTVWGRGGV